MVRHLVPRVRRPNPPFPTTRRGAGSTGIGRLPGDTRGARREHLCHVCPVCPAQPCVCSLVALRHADSEKRPNWEAKVAYFGSTMRCIVKFVGSR